MTNTAQSDINLVKRVQKGDKKAFDPLVIKYQQRIANLVSRFIRDQDEVLDVTQEAFIKAYRALPNFRGDSQFYTWLYRVAINTAKNHLATLSRRPPQGDIEAEIAEQMDMGTRLKEQETPERLAEEADLKAVILEAVDQLPEELKTALTLREIDGLSYDEIAEAMDCPIGTVRSRIFRAREAVDKAIKPLMGHDE
jgi:RNA polymerase sigma-70 factor (ECF subfamily)